MMSNNLNQGASIEAELLPCPFCGGKADIFKTATKYAVECDNAACTVNPDALATFKHEAIAAWNRRTPAAAAGAGELPERIADIEGMWAQAMQDPNFVADIEKQSQDVAEILANPAIRTGNCFPDFADAANRPYYTAEQVEEIARAAIAADRAQLAAKGQGEPVAWLDRDGRMTDELRSFIEGMSVSMDVSTGDHDAGHRYFGIINEVMDDDGDKNGVTLLVYEAHPNFAAPASAQPVEAGCHPWCGYIGTECGFPHCKTGAQPDQRESAAEARVAVLDEAAEAAEDAYINAQCSIERGEFSQPIRQTREAISAAIRALAAAPSTAAQPVAKDEQPEIKDHNVRQLVNDLTAIGQKFGATQQLRSRVSSAVTQFLGEQYGWKVAAERQRDSANNSAEGEKK
jgi:hypothetical protein